MRKNIIAYKKKILAAVIVLLIAAAGYLSVSTPKKAEALTTANVDSAVKVGNGGDLYDSNSQKLNTAVGNDLVNKLFGTDDPVDYIKTQGAADYNTYKDNYPAGTDPYYVVPATQINTKAGVDDKGLIVTLGGLEWMVASLTLADVGSNISQKDNVIVTLYLADASADVTPYGWNDSNTNGVTMYSSCVFRNRLLNLDGSTTDNFSQFTMFRSGTFAQNYLVQPQFIKYQEVETQYGRTNPAFGLNYNMPNEAYGDLPSNWALGYYKPGYSFDGTAIGGTMANYEDWKNDYIWIPSVTEIGSATYVTTSIWNMTAAQNASSGIAWLRSGFPANNTAMMAVLANGDVTYANGRGTGITTARIRPAIHLNVTELLGNILNDPENVTTTYNGEAQTVKSAYTANPTDLSWYDAKRYEHTDNYVTVTYYDKNGADSTSIKDAGDYWVKVEIQQKWIDDVNAQIEADGANYGWSSTQIDEAKNNKRPKFRGDADTSDPAHTESATVRWFKFKINPKELTVNKPEYDKTTGVFTAPTFADESEFCDSNHPILATRFTGTAADGTNYNAIDEMPTKRCVTPYTAKAILVNSATDKTEYTGNYVIKNASSITCQVQINRSRLPIVSVSAANGTKPYTGSKITFPLTGYSSEWAKTASLILPDGVTLEGSDDDGWVLAVTDAGNPYTVRASLNAGKSTDWCWDTENFQEELVADRTFTFTVTRKTLLVDFTSSTNAFLLEAGSAVTFDAVPNNAVAGDEVKLTLSYGPVSSGEKIPVSSGSLDASTLNPGSYYLYATLEDGAATHNKNYVLNGGEASRQFTVNAKKITLNSVDWQYSQNNGTPVDIDISVGAGTSAGSPFTVTYNGSAYVFSIKTADLATAGAKIDISYGSGGYANGMQTNAMSSAVGVTVRLVPLDNQYAFYDQNGVPQTQQYKDFTLYVKVNKAEVDFSNVQWSADELEYNAVNQTVRIVSGFPSFLTPSYNTASTGREVNDYQAKVTGVTVSNATVAANYNVPSSTQIAGIAELTHDWKIIKKKINVNWTSVEETGEGGTVIFVPTISDNSANAVEYTYYNADKSRQMTLDEIFDDYDATQMKDYWVCVRLKASGGSYNATNCVLMEGGQEVTESFHGFNAGESKNPVRVGLVTNQTVYNRADQPAEIQFEGGNLTESDFVISYKLSDGTPCGTPRNAGSYKVVVQLNVAVTGDYAITGQCEFEYEIKKADYDVSAMKWVDTLNGNAEYTEAYVWAYDAESETKGRVHTLSFVGENIDGLNVGYTAATEEKLTGSNAGTYRVVVEFSVVDPDNYNVPENIEFTWEIKAVTADLSEVKWNYESAFTYSIGEEGPVKYSVYLINLPEGLEELITYTGDTGEYSDAGGHATTFSVDTTSPMYGNFVAPLVFGAGVENRLVWEIKSLTIEKPQQRQTQVFRAEGYTFAEITNLPEDWAQYFAVEVVDGDNDTVAPVEGTWQFMDVNQYRIKIQFKPGMNTSVGGATDNVKWSDNGRAAYQVTLTLKTLVFPVQGWTDQGENVRPVLNADETAEIERYFDYVLFNTETEQEVPLNSTLEWETVYTIALKLKAEYAGNVAVKYLNREVEETTPYAFQTDVDPLADPPTNFYRKPTGEELNIAYRYTGNEIEFKLGNWFVEEKMQIMYGSVTKGTDEGTYQVRVGFKKGALSAWLRDDDEIDRSPVTITYTISADAKANDRFILKDIYKDNHSYKFLYANFNEANDVEEYEYDASNLLYIARLALNDTLADLLAQFENGDEITAWTAAGVQITDLSTVLATGMMLRLTDGETVLNQLIISVLGDVNGDGRINVTDKTQINANLAGKRQLDAANLLASDINGDGRINVTDKTQLNAQLAGKRDIYAGLSLKTARSNAVSNASAPIFVSEIVEPIDTEITFDFVEEGKFATSEETVAVVSVGDENAVRESETIQSGVIYQEIIADKTRYAICGRKEFGL